MLTTWLVELFLNDLGALKDEGDRDGYENMTQEFHAFLETKNLRVSDAVYATKRLHTETDSHYRGNK